MKGIERKLHKIDAQGRKLGRVATEIATILMGKHRADYQPHQDHGDIVHVENVDQLSFDKKKIAQKTYYHHSGYPGGLKETPMAKLLEEGRTDEVLKRAVFQMLPDNKLRNGRIKRLNIN